MRAAQAEFERQILSQRTKEGMEAARQRGVRIGRPSSISGAQIETARRMVDVEGKTITEAARELTVNRWTLSRALRRGA